MPEPLESRASPARFGNASEERFVISRRYAAGTGGVRGLLITVLGDYVRPARQPAPTSAFIDVLGRLGVEEDACRQALSRASRDGWLVPRRDGRYTWWQLSPAFAQFLALGASRIFGFTATQPHWDRRWLVVVARVPESDRAVRHLLHTRLRWAGFGRPSPGVWVSTHTGRVKEAEDILRDAGAHEQSRIFLSEYVAGGELPAMVREAWDLDEMDRQYEGFIAEFSRQPSADPIVRVTRLVHAWRLLALVDPALPEELLPKGWSGIRAVRLFHRQHARWEPAALREWGRISREAR
ncbi:PaaX family transcriptional regulator C-terminal domain-containing protein [Micromonospora sp. WMMD1102]|uniref:PaaX family transcriptional regulator n=1 Tax=Micromonospora sp. WMMD1102 TaxID=3016105 RepID=UPI0024150623|nr:PaaX family transcriptional regulator C-terminal domain-containing protein [Micromonospora sp. WMMD1102]MDG4789334.1 PaaX family transcriptional regulator C-terminal domain-containing protein [Micromonospora sp. WMMD1102]